MLQELYIKNFGIFAEERLQLKSGMTVFTGETGAGKSLVVGAIALVMGARASTEDIRSGAEEATIEAIFTLPNNPQLRATLDEAGITIEKDANELIIKRLLQVNGRGRTLVNGSSVTLAQLAAIAQHLIDLSGQHEQQILLDDARHLQILDHYASQSAEHAKLLAAFQGTFATVRDLKQQLSELQNKQRTAAERADFLRFRVQELQTLALKPNEDEELRNSLKRMQNSIKLYELTTLALDHLDAEGAILERLGQVRRQLEKSLDFDPALKQQLTTLNDAQAHLEELSSTFNKYGESLNFDPAERDQAEARLFKISEASRKYGSLQAAIEQLQSMQDELNGLENVGDAITKVDRQLQTSSAELLQLARALSESRHAAALKLKKVIEKELSELAMEGSRFAVALPAVQGQERGAIQIGNEAISVTPFGLEQAFFQFSANRGEELRPLVKVASGGELSRLLLAVKLALANEMAATFIFDEVDAGISGRQAEVVGRKLKTLAVAPNRQVFCVTHLAPIAAYGDQHLQIAKNLETGRTVARAMTLDKKARTVELARLLAGEKITDRTLAHAEEMLQNSAVN